MSKSELDKNFDAKYKSLKITLNFIRHGESCQNLAAKYVGNGLSSTLVPNPPLTKTGEEQTKILNFKDIGNIDFIGTSQLIRAFETASNGMGYSAKGRLNVLPFINETRALVPIDVTNEPNIEKIKEIIKNQKKWYDDLKIEPVFDIFDEVAKIPGININKSSYDDFIKYVLPLIIKKILKEYPDKEEVNIALVSHGNFMKDHFTKAHGLVFKEHIGNTEIWRETFKITDKGPIYEKINECGDVALKEKTCSITAIKVQNATIEPKKSETVEKANFDDCYKEMKKQGTISSFNEFIYPYAFSGHLSKDITKQVEQDINKTKQEIKKDTETAGEKLEQTVKDAKETVKEGVENTGEKLEQTAKDAKETVKEGVENTGEKLEQTAKDAKETVKEGVENTGEKLEETAKDVKEESKNVAGTIGATTSEIGKQIADTAKAAADKVADLFNNLTKTDKSDVNELGEKAAAETESVLSSAAQKTGDTLALIGEKTVNLSSEAYDATKKAASTALDTINKTFKSLTGSTDKPTITIATGGKRRDIDYEAKYKKYKKKYMLAKY
jgi:broad specificity phosphatase PhoE